MSEPTPSSPAPTRYRRRRYIIDREFQYAFVTRAAGLLTLTATLIFVVFVLWNYQRFGQNFLTKTPSSQQLLSWSQANNIEPDSVEFASQYIVQSSRHGFVDMIWEPITVVLLVNLVLSVILNILLSHRIAGPILKIKRTIESHLAGENPGPIHLRTTDYFRDLSVLINRLMAEGRKPVEGPPDR